MVLVYKVSAFLPNMTVPTISKEYTIFAKIFYIILYSVGKVVSSGCPNLIGIKYGSIKRLLGRLNTIDPILGILKVILFVLYLIQKNIEVLSAFR